MGRDHARDVSWMYEDFRVEKRSKQRKKSRMMWQPMQTFELLYRIIYRVGNADGLCRKKQIVLEKSGFFLEIGKVKRQSQTGD